MQNHLKVAIAIQSEEDFKELAKKLIAYGLMDEDDNLDYFKGMAIAPYIRAAGDVVGFAKDDFLILDYTELKKNKPELNELTEPLRGEILKNTILKERTSLGLRDTMKFFNLLIKENEQKGEAQKGYKEFNELFTRKIETEKEILKAKTAMLGDFLKKVKTFRELKGSFNWCFERLPIAMLMSLDIECLTDESPIEGLEDLQIRSGAMEFFFDSI